MPGLGLSCICYFFVIFLIIIMYKNACRSLNRAVSVNGGWTDFEEWPECSVECGGGTQTRTRTCTNPAPAYEGADCVGDSSQTRECNTHPCPSKMNRMQINSMIEPSFYLIFLSHNFVESVFYSNEPTQGWRKELKPGGGGGGRF